MLQKKITSTRHHGARYFFALLIAFFMSAVVLYYLNSSYASFVVKDFNTGNILFEKRIKIGDKIKLAYIHSVTNQYIYEIFKVENNKTLSLIEMYYDSFGANLPVGPEKLADETTTFEVKDSYYKITYQNRKFKKMPLRVGQVVSDHTLVFSDNTELRLLDIASGGAYIELYVQPLINFKFKL